MTSSEDQKKFSVLQLACLALAMCSMAVGSMGLVLSFLFLASSSHADIAAGSAGFVAGAIFFGSGLISLSMVSRDTK
jgi:hypothetical protein